MRVTRWFVLRGERNQSVPGETIWTNAWLCENEIEARGSYRANVNSDPDYVHAFGKWSLLHGVSIDSCTVGGSFLSLRGICASWAAVTGVMNLLCRSGLANDVREAALAGEANALEV